MPSPFQRLRDRKLVQWALAYLAGGWVFLEIAGHVGNQFHWPDAVQRALIILAGCGLFVVLVIAWYHGERGRQRVSGPELLMVAALLVVAGVALTTLGPTGDELSGGMQLPPLASPDDRPSVAVLPCANFSPDPEDAYLALGLHDEILNRLSKISGLATKGRTWVRQYADASPDANFMARQLGVGFVGECSVTKVGDQLRLVFQLLEASGGTHIWSQSFDYDFTISNLLTIYTLIAEEVAAGVGATLKPVEADRIRTQPTDNLLAYELYQRGRARWASRTLEGLRAALDLFEAAIAEDSTFALAYAGLAQTHLSLGLLYSGVDDSPSARMQAAKRLASRAAALDAQQSVAHAALGYVAFLFDWDWSLAEDELNLAVTLDPGDSQARAWLAEVLITLGRPEEGLVQASRAAQADPASIAENSTLAFALWSTGQTSEAERQFEHVISLPGGAKWGWGLGGMLEQEARFEEANRASLEAFRVMYPEEFVDSLEVALRAVWDPALRQRGVSILRHAERTVPGYPPQVSWLASIGAMDEAVAAARRAIEVRSHVVSFFTWPNYRAAHSDPRFLAILDELGLPRPD